MMVHNIRFKGVIGKLISKLPRLLLIWNTVTRKNYCVVDSGHGLHHSLVKFLYVMDKMSHSV